MADTWKIHDAPGQYLGFSFSLFFVFRFSLTELVSATSDTV